MGCQNGRIAANSGTSTYFLHDAGGRDSATGWVPMEPDRSLPTDFKTWLEAAPIALADLRAHKAEIPLEVRRRFMRAYLRIKALSSPPVSDMDGPAIPLEELERLIGTGRIAAADGPI